MNRYLSLVVGCTWTGAAASSRRFQHASSRPPQKEDGRRKGCSGRDLNPYALWALEPESSVSAIPPPERLTRRSSKGAGPVVSRSGLAEGLQHVGAVEVLAELMPDAFEQPGMRKTAGFVQL
jgi:hypothetical protein